MALGRAVETLEEAAPAEFATFDASHKAWKAAANRGGHAADELAAAVLSEPYEEWTAARLKAKRAKAEFQVAKSALREAAPAAWAAYEAALRGSGQDMVLGRRGGASGGTASNT